MTQDFKKFGSNPLNNFLSKITMYITPYRKTSPMGVDRYVRTFLKEIPGYNDSVSISRTKHVGAISK